MKSFILKVTSAEKTKQNFNRLGETFFSDKNSNKKRF
jgi:hypothetical protein